VQMDMSSQSMAQAAHKVAGRGHMAEDSKRTDKAFKQQATVEPAPTQSTAKASKQMPTMESMVRRIENQICRLHLLTGIEGPLVPVDTDAMGQTPPPSFRSTDAGRGVLRAAAEDVGAAEQVTAVAAAPAAPLSSHLADERGEEPLAAAEDAVATTAAMAPVASCLMPPQVRTYARDATEDAEAATVAREINTLPMDHSRSPVAKPRVGEVKHIRHHL